MAAPARVLPFQRQAGQGMFDWIGEYSRQEKVPVFTCPDIFVTICDGDALCAIFLSQICFMQQQRGPEAWIVASTKEWHDRFGISAYQVRNYAERLKTMGLKAKKRGVRPSITWHFQLDVEQLHHVVEGHYKDSATMKNLDAANDEIFHHQPLKTSSLTMKNLTVNDEKFNGSIEREKEDYEDQEDTITDANASVGVTADSSLSFEEKPEKVITEDAAEYKLACYLYDAIHHIDTKRPMPASRTTKGLSTWIDPPKGNGLRGLLAEREREDIRQVIDWLALPTTTSYWQSRFLNRRNNPGKMLYDSFSEMCNASKPRTQAKGATNAKQDRAPATSHHDSTRADVF